MQKLETGMAEAENGSDGRRKRLRCRREQVRRDLRILARLGAGVSVGEIAARESLSPRRVRELVAKRLAERALLPTEQFAALQVGRLSEALLVSYGSMTGGNLQAVDRVVKIVRELDRYHGFAPADRAPALAPAAPRIALATPIPPPADAEFRGAAVIRPISG
jgi:hypothetical protein